MSVYPCVPQMRKMLQNLDGWLEKATKYAADKKFAPEVLLNTRLAPDQYPLVKQVQAACDAAKFAAARLAQREPPKHPDTETTMAELRQRVETVVAYLDTFSEADFLGAAERKIELPFLEGKVLRGADYLQEMSLPNFYFHVTTAYAILRHSGVDLGKRDFIGSMKLEDK